MRPPSPSAGLIIRPNRARGSCRGILLIEAVVYMGLFLVITGLASAAFFRIMDTSKHLRRAAQDIGLALTAGERWRADVRAAIAPPQLTEEGGGQVLSLPQRTRVVHYVLEGGAVMRQSGTNAPWMKVLAGLREAKLYRDQQAGVVSWRWEIELGGALKTPRLQPRFTFQAVAPGDTR